MEIGVDEAGKGPVLGSMFAAAVRIDPDDLPADVADSKTVDPEDRERLAAEIRSMADSVSVAEITVAQIDDPDTDMNALTVEAHARALSGLTAEDVACRVDAGDTNAVRFERRVADRLDVVPDLYAEHGADETYPVVSAASILAKVERDAHVTDIAGEYGAVGSGYPSDQTTRDFLKRYVREHGRLPDCARESWQTSQDVLAALEQATLGEF
jgi:ribonuclease HII